MKKIKEHLNAMNPIVRNLTICVGLVALVLVLYLVSFFASFITRLIRLISFKTWVVIAVTAIVTSVAFGIFDMSKTKDGTYKKTSKGKSSFTK